MQVTLKRVERGVDEAIVVECQGLALLLCLFLQRRKRHAPAAEEVGQRGAGRHDTVLRAAREEHLLSRMSNQRLVTETFDDGLSRLPLGDLLADIFSKSMQHSLRDGQLVAVHELGRGRSPLHEHGPRVKDLVLDLVTLLALNLTLELA